MEIFFLNLLSLWILFHAAEMILLPEEWIQRREWEVFRRARNHSYVKPAGWTLAAIGLSLFLLANVMVIFVLFDRSAPWRAHPDLGFSEILGGLSSSLLGFWLRTRLRSVMLSFLATWLMATGFGVASAGALNLAITRFVQP